MSDVSAFPEDAIDPFRHWLASNSGKLTEQQIADLTSKLMDGQITALQLSTLLKLAPTIAGPLIEFIRLVPKMSGDINQSEAAALAANKHIFDEQISALKELMKQAASEATRQKIAEGITAAAKMAHKGVAEIHTNAHKSRKGLNKTISAGLTGLIGFGLTVARLAR